MQTARICPGTSTVFPSKIPIFSWAINSRNLCQIYKTTSSKARLIWCYRCTQTQTRTSWRTSDCRLTPKAEIRTFYRALSPLTSSSRMPSYRPWAAEMTPRIKYSKTLWTGARSGTQPMSLSSCNNMKAIKGWSAILRPSTRKSCLFARAIRSSLLTPIIPRSCLDQHLFSRNHTTK